MAAALKPTEVELAIIAAVREAGSNFARVSRVDGQRWVGSNN